MRNITFSAFILLLTIFLGACSEKDLDQDEVMEEVKKSIDDVESYHTLWDVAMEMDYLEMDQTEHSNVKMDIDAIESSNEMRQTVEESDDANQSVVEYYMIEDTMYVNDNDSGWVSESINTIDIQENLTLSYKKIATLLEEIEDELEMETDDDHYILTFKGSSQNVFDAQDEPYSLEVTGFDEDGVNQDLKIKVDKENLYIMNVENTVTAKNNQKELEMKIVQDFSDINAIDEIELPEEIEEEVSKWNLTFQEDRAVQYFSSMRMYGVPLAPITTPTLNESTIPPLISRGDRVIYRTILLIPFIFIVIGIDVTVRMTPLMRFVDF